MRIGLIGCGRAGISIFHVLRKYNKIVGVYDSNARNQKTAVKLLSVKANPSYRELIEQSEVLFIATPDDVICKAYNKMKRLLKGEKYIYHFSAILPADILTRKEHVFRASIHPFATFPRIAIPSTRRHFFLSIEGDRKALKCARVIFRPHHFTLNTIKKRDKPLYHLIGVFSSNLLVGLVASVYKIARMMGWRQRDIRQLVFPIITETLNNVESYGLRDSLSGPLRRGDLQTVKKHLKVLQKNKDLLRIYKDLSLYIAQNLTTARKKDALIKLLSN